MQRLLDGSAERIETCVEVTRDVCPQGATAALREYFEIAARLRLLDYAKGVGLARHRQILGIVASDLQEDAAVWSALVGLPRRVLKTRPEADTRRCLGPIANDAAKALHGIDMGRAAIDIGEQRCVVPSADPPVMGL